MSLNNQQTQQIEDILRNALRHKLQNYKPKPGAMPFHTRLLGKDRMALFLFVHSLNLNFGTSIFEPVAKTLASFNYFSAQSQQVAGNKISSEAQRVIQTIMDNLAIAQTDPNKAEEIKAIRTVCQAGEMRTVKPTKVDIKLVGQDGVIYLLDIKTAKPNAGGFKEFKRTLLEWVAAALAENPQADVQTMIAIPYNPYAPNPYRRWTMRGMLDLRQELKVAEEFWDFLGGSGSYENLLDIFERIGMELRPEIDHYFTRYNK
jgi:type II restriction enzyme